MFLQIPEVESRISGMSASCTLLSENIAVEHPEHILLDEQLQIVVEHDGSNPFCDPEPCCWGIVIVAAATERTPSLPAVDDEHPFEFHCLSLKLTIVM
jgi:hypothetical protein